MPRDAKIDRDVAYPELSEGDLRHPVRKCRVEVHHFALCVGVEAEERDEELDERAGRPCLGNVRPEVLDGKRAGISGEPGEELGWAL